MIEELEARKRILESTSSGPVMWVPISMAVDGVAAETLGARLDCPVFDNSSMDGYAVRASECRTGDTLNVAGQVQAAGPDLDLILKPGEALRIFTGAAIPRGADAVIMQEDVEFVDDERTAIRIVEGVELAENIRRRGSDVCEGQRILSKGERIKPTTIGLLASQGLPNVPIFSRPMVNIVTTGDELVETGEWLGEGEIYNSNGPMLTAAVERLGGIAARFHAMDDRGHLRSVLENALHTGDFVIIAGGVSVGDRDFVKETLTDLGVTTEFWRVNVKPGKPFVFGRFEDRVSVFGLPGNPVSAFVTFSMFAGPAIQKWLGKKDVSADQPALESFSGVLGTDLENRGDRPHYLRVKVDRENGNRITPFGVQQSHAVHGLAQADALVRLAASESLQSGQSVTGWWI